MRRSKAPSQIHSDNLVNEPKRPRFSSNDHFPATPMHSDMTQDPLSGSDAAVDKELPSRQFVVVYAVCSTRKHKHWEGDGILTSQNTTLILEDTKNGRKRIAASYRNNKVEVEHMGEGHNLIVGGYEVQIEHEIVEPKYVDFVTYCEASELQVLLAEGLQDITTIGENMNQDFLSRLYCHPRALHERLRGLVESHPRDIAFVRLLESFPSNYLSTECRVNESGKLDALVKLVKKFDEQKENVVIATSITTSVDIIENLLDEMGCDVFRIDGKTPSVKKEIYERFNTRDGKAKILIMHTDATTCGYTAKSSTKLILFDVGTWSVELDIKDRVWLKTQPKECEIYRIVVKDSYEEVTYKFDYANVEEENKPIEINLND